MSGSGKYARFYFSGIAASALIFAMSMGAPQPESGPETRSINAFAIDLYGHLNTGEGNFFISPYSISTCLAMAYAGARGETAEQMAKALHFDLPQEELHHALGKLYQGLNSSERQKRYELSTANALWLQEQLTILNPFSETITNNYGAGIQQVDFQKQPSDAAKKINDWVSDETKGKIKDLLSPVQIRDASLVLANAIYFKGDWLTRFKKSATKEDDFFLTPENRIRVPLMHQQSLFGYAETPDAQILAMPYVNNDLAMVVFLPRATDGLHSLESNMSVDYLNSVTESIQTYTVDVTFPRFEMSATYELSHALKQMGMKDAFNLFAADFSGIDGRKNLFIMLVAHKTYVKVSEEGTEAAASTGAVIGCASAPPLASAFRADHPFLFLIRDNKSGAILFMGRVMDPRV